MATALWSTLSFRRIATARSASRLLLLEHLVALGADRRQRDDEQEHERGDQQAEADRALEEDHRIAAGNPHCPPQVLLHQGPEHETEDQPRRLAFDPVEDVAGNAEERR